MITSPGALVLAAALGVALGTLFPTLWFLALLGLGLLFFVLRSRTSSALRASLYGFIVGIASGGAGVWWMWDMLPIHDPVGIAPLTQIIVAGSVWGMTALLAGIATALAALLLYLFRGNAFFALLAGVVWVLQEETRMWLYAVFSYSPESLFGPHFSQTAAGYALAENGYLLQLAHFGGIAALNFSIAALAASAVLLIHGASGRIRSLPARVALVLTLSILAAPLAAPHDAQTFPPLRVAIISLASAPDAPRMVELLRHAASSTPDLVIIPESDTLESFLPEERTRKNVLHTLFSNTEGLVVSAGYETAGGKTHSVLAYTDSLGRRIESYRKMFLMPQGEYYPLAALPLFSLSGDPKMSEYVKDAGHRLVRGNGLIAVPFRGSILGGLICSELISPYLYKELARGQGANILINLANPSWFHGSRSYFDKTVQIAKVQAVENNAPMLVANNGSPSFAIDAYGSLLAKAAWGKDEILFVALEN